MPPPALPPPVGDPPLPPEALAPLSPVQPAMMSSQTGKEQQRSLPPRSLLLQPSAGAVAELTGSRSPSVSPTTSLHPPPSSMSSFTSRPVRQLPTRFAASSSATTAAVADARGAAHPDSNATAAPAAAHHLLPVPTARHLHPLLAFAGIEDDADELEGLGENESAWDEGFHPTTTSLPKKRKIPSAHSLGGGIGGGANSNAGGLHVTPSSPASSSSSSPPQLDAHALRMHAKYGSLGSRGGGGAWAATASSAAFAHFPSLPRGFISAPRPVIPVPLASVSRTVVDLDQGLGPQFGQPQSARRRQLQHPYPRASPPARAYLWAKAVWAERKRLLSAKLCVEPDGGEGWLAPDEEKAVEFGGSVWGRGWENVESGNGGSGGGGGSGRSKTPPIASNTASISRRRKRRLAAGHEPDARREGAMRGVRELLTKDGLSITAVVREEIDWSAGKRKALSASSEFEDKAFDFACESEATTHIGEIIDLLGSLRDRLKSAVNLLRDLAPALGADGLPLSDAECDDDDLELPGHRHPSSLLDHDGLATSDQHLQQPERFIDVGMQTLPVAPKPEDELLRGRVVTPSPRLPGGEPPTAVFSMSSEATETITTTTVVPPSQLPPPPPPPPTKKKTGKKKRSALANAANPHHMKNYVPSRLLSDAPASSQGSGHHTSSSSSPSSLGGPGGLLSLLFPPPTRFLSATPRHKSRRSGSGSEPAPLGATVSSDEYVCVFCDYALFYSPDENRRRRTVGKRKKLLARRRRAKERASRGVAGKGKTLAPISRTQDDEDDEEDLCDGEEEGGKCRRCAERRSSEHGKKKGKKKKGRPKGGERAVAVSTADGGVQTCDL